MGTNHIALADAGPQVRDVMLVGPETVPPTATVAQAREVFASPRQKLLLVCDGSRYVGALEPAALEGADGAETVDGRVVSGVEVLAPDAPTDRVEAIVAATGRTRIPVVDADGELLGLVCFNRSKGAFCVA